MKPEKFLELFKSKIKKSDSSSYIDFLLISSLSESKEVTEDNWKELKEKFSIKMMYAKVPIQSILIYLNVYDEVLVDNVLNSENSEHKKSTAAKTKPNE